MVTVKVLEDRDGNPNLERALKKFKKEVMKEGIMKAYEEKRYFVKPLLKSIRKKFGRNTLIRLFRSRKNLQKVSLKMPKNCQMEKL